MIVILLAAGGVPALHDAVCCQGQQHEQARASRVVWKAAVAGALLGRCSSCVLSASASPLACQPRALAPAVSSCLRGGSWRAPQLQPLHALRPTEADVAPAAVPRVAVPAAQRRAGGAPPRLVRRRISGSTREHRTAASLGASALAPGLRTYELAGCGARAPGAHHQELRTSSGAAPRAVVFCRAPGRGGWRAGWPSATQKGLRRTRTVAAADAAGPSSQQRLTRATVASH